MDTHYAKKQEQKRKATSDWNPQGCRRGGRPKRTWSRAEDEIRTGRP